jgi:hypothetical protein
MRKNLPLDSVRMDKTSFSINSLDENSDEKQYWLSKKPVDRVYAVELMRQILYGYNPLTERLQIFFETAELS